MRGGVTSLVLARSWRAEMLSWHFDFLNHPFFLNIRNYEAVEVAHSDIHCLPVCADHIGPRPAADWNVSRVVHFLEIDDVDLMRSHGAHEHISIAASVESVVRLFNRQSFHYLLLCDIDDVHTVAIANRHC